MECFMKIANMMLVAGAAAVLALTGCEKKDATDALSKAADATKSAAADATKAAGDAAAKTADAAKDTAAKATESVKDAATAAKDAGTKAVDSATDVATKAADAAKEGVAKLQAEGGKWLSETVEKQWPAMKSEFEGLTKKVGSITDAGKKTQAEGLVKDLQGQIPSIEKLVGDLKGFKEGDYSKMFTEAKKMWDGFGSKLGELKKLLPA
jgi:hypothetical protein